MKKSYWIAIVILIVLTGIIVKIVSFYNNSKEAVETATKDIQETVEEETNFQEKNASFIDTGAENLEGVAIDVMELTTELAMTECGSTDTSIYTIHPSEHKRADGSVEYITSYQYQIVEKFGLNNSYTSTTDIYTHLTDEFYSDDPLGMKRAFNPGEWKWGVASKDEDPVLSAKLSSAATINDEFIVKWTLIAQGEELDYSQSTVKPLQCPDGALYISSPFSYETEKLQALPDDAKGFFQVKIYYKDVRLEATTLSF